MVLGVEEAIHTQDKLLLILSHHAVQSLWVQHEGEAALYKQVTSGRETLFPIRLDNTILESNTQWAKRWFLRRFADSENGLGEIEKGHRLREPIAHLPTRELLSNISEPA